MVPNSLQPGSSLPGQLGYGWLCKPESSCESFLWWNPKDDSSCCPTSIKLCWTWSHAVAHGVAPHSIVQWCRKGHHFNWSEACRCTNCENQPHQSTSNCSLHMKTKRLMAMNIDLILHCVVLLQLECWKESAHHSCMLDQYMLVQHSTIHYCILSDDRPTGSWNTV